MAIPRFFWGNLLTSGTLSGTNTNPTYPVRRLQDGYLGLPYPIVSGAPAVVSGEIGVEFSIGGQMPAVVTIPFATALSGFAYIFEGEVAVNDPPTLLASGTFTSNGPLFFEVSGAACEVLRLRIGPVSGSPTVPRLGELQLAREFVPGRSPQVGVARNAIRQFQRFEIPGGQPFVIRQGPLLRTRTYLFTLISGAEVSELNSFLNAVDGGQPFYHVDDEGAEFWAELVGFEQTIQDEAGVYGVAMRVQEIRAE